MSKNRNGNTSSKRDRLFWGLQEVCLSANIALALSYALFLYITRSSTAWTPQNDSGYYFLCGAARVSDFLHFGAINAFSTDAAVRRGLSVQWNWFAIEITSLASVCSVTALIFLMIRLLDKSPRYRAIFSRIAGVAALFATPACCLIVLKLTWGWPLDLPPSSLPFGRTLLFSVFTGEILGFFALLLIGRRRTISAWTSATLLVLHFAFWSWVLFPNIILYLRGYFVLSFLHLMPWLIPSVGTAWLLYVKPQRATSDDDEGKVSKWILAPAVLGTITLLAIWAPRWSHRTLRPKDLESAVVELTRGPCRGNCPAYTITIHGDGVVQYVGKSFVKVRATQTSSTNNAEIARILRRLDQAHFFALDDRAFSWCFDTPSVSVTVSLNGKSKTVASDGLCTGAKRGVQDEFVKAADDIDKIIGSDRWVRCEGHCRT